MKEYFNYFDKVYLINLPKRTERLNTSLGIFRELEIYNYKIIVPKENLNIPKDCLLNQSGLSCKMSHMECLQDAVNNKYNKICIFEDDICWNQDDLEIHTNIDFHLNKCFNFLNSKKWDIFYFDNIKYIVKDMNDYVKKILRVQNTTEGVIWTKGKGFAHSYAVNGDAINILLNYHKSNNIRNDVNLAKVDLHDKYLYSAGIFDQKIGIISDNKWYKI